jgi:hypothetical protein
MPVPVPSAQGGRIFFPGPDQGGGIIPGQAGRARREGQHDRQRGIPLLEGRSQAEARLRVRGQECWQPQVRAKAKEKTAPTVGLVVSTARGSGSRPRRAPPTTPRSVTSPRSYHLSSRTASSPPESRDRAATPVDRGRRPCADVLPRQQHPRTRPGRGFHRRGAHRHRTVAGLVSGVDVFTGMVAVW